LTPPAVRTALVSLLVIGVGYACARGASSPSPVSSPIEIDAGPPAPETATSPAPPEAADAGIADVAAAPPDDSWTMLAVGDIQLGRTIYAEMVDLDDYTFPMRAVADRLSAADLTVGNLEAQIFDRCKVLRVGMRLCAGPRAMESIDRGGFDVLTVANNHATNFGKRSLQESVERLRERGIAVAGYGKQIPVVEIEGTDVAFLGWSPVHEQLPLKRIASQIEKARARADLVFAFVHWGIEYETTPSRAQERLADFIASKGVDLIIGSHPHVVQPMEQVRETLVAYSLGNFVFDFMWGEALRGAVGEFVVDEGRITSSRLIPVQIDEMGAPHFVEE
jgi:poly-gamma-glutamate synthesis protein (capsule biosynthesis protein)